MLGLIKLHGVRYRRKLKIICQINQRIDTQFPIYKSVSCSIRIVVLLSTQKTGNTLFPANKNTKRPNDRAMSITLIDSVWARSYFRLFRECRNAEKIPRNKFKGVQKNILNPHRLTDFLNLIMCQQNVTSKREINNVT